jgi:adenylate cyclase
MTNPLLRGERAVALDPGSADSFVDYGGSLINVGRPEEAIPLLQKAIRLSPFGWSSIYRVYANALMDTGRFEEAVSAYKKAIQLAPDNIIPHFRLAATYIMMGREEEARAEVGEIRRINPKFSLDRFAKILAYKDQSQKNKIINALRKAGVE